MLYWQAATGHDLGGLIWEHFCPFWSTWGFSVVKLPESAAPPTEPSRGKRLSQCPLWTQGLASCQHTQLLLCSPRHIHTVALLKKGSIRHCPPGVRTSRDKKVFQVSMEHLPPEPWHGLELSSCSALPYSSSRVEVSGWDLCFPNFLTTSQDSTWASWEGEGNRVFWWVLYRECPLIFLFQSVMTSAQPWGTLLTCSYRETMMPILNKLKSITKTLMFWKPPIFWRAVLMRSWQQRISRMLWVLWWVRLCVNVPVGPV